MPTTMEDEDKMGRDEDLAKAEQEALPEKPSDSSLIKAYLEDKNEEEKEEKKKLKEAKDEAIVETQEYKK